MWRDLSKDEIKYLNKVVLDLKKQIKIHGIVMLITYLIMFIILFLTKLIKIEYAFEILELCAINPFMWIFVYVYIKLSHTIYCLSEEGYTKCIDVKVLEMIPEDSSKNTNWYANVKTVDTGDMIENVLCYKEKKTKELLSKKGIYPEVLMIDLASKRKREKREKVEKENKVLNNVKDYLIYDLTDL